MDSNGQKVADSDVNKSAAPESFANLNSFKNALNGQSGSIIDILGNTNMLITYKPVKAFQNTFVVLLMQANNSNIKEDSWNNIRKSQLPDSNIQIFLWSEISW